MGGGPSVAWAGISVLLVDDDVELGALMEKFFARRGIALETVADGSDGLTRALSGGHDLLLLDVMMPGLDGVQLLQPIRRARQVPVIMLTAHAAQTDRVMALDAGADDYLLKPIGFEELVARIRAVLRRAGQGRMSAHALEVLDLEEEGVKLIPSAREVRCA